MGQAVANTFDEQKKDDVTVIDMDCFRFGPSTGASQIRRYGTTAKHLAFSNSCNTYGAQLTNRHEETNYCFDLGVRAQVFLLFLPESSFQSRFRFCDFDFAMQAQAQALHSTSD